MASGLFEKTWAMEHGTALWISRRENEPCHPGQADGACAHRTGFERDIERRAKQTLIAKLGRSFAQHENFGMGSRVPKLEGAIAIPGKDYTVRTDQNRANRHFLACSSRLGFGQCQ